MKRGHVLLVIAAAAVMLILAGGISSAKVMKVILYNNEMDSHNTGFGSDIVIEAGQTSKEAVAIGGDVIVNGQVDGEAVALFGDVIVKGHVTGDAVALLGDVKLEPGARVDGDASAVLGHLEKGEGATIGGEIVSIGPSNIFSKVFPPHGFPWVLLVIRISIILTQVILMAVMVALFPERVERIARTVIAQPGRSALWGFVFKLSLIPIFLILVISCIGIPFFPVALTLALVIRLFGYAAIGLVLGRRLGEALHRPVTSVVWAAVIGMLVLSLVSLIPIVGWLVNFVLIMIGEGAVLITRLGSSPVVAGNSSPPAAAE